MSECSEKASIKVRNRLPLAIFACTILVLINCYEWRNFFVDDAFIGFRCIDNFLTGRGFLFNPGQKVEAVTNIGWLAVIIPFAGFFSIHVAGKIAGALAVLLAVILICMLGSRLDRSLERADEASYLGIIIPLLVFSEPAFVYFSLSGMETAFLACLIATAALLIDKASGMLLVAVITGMAYAVRPECLILFPLIAFLAYFQPVATNAPGARRILISMAVWAAVILMITAARSVYFASLFPNTFYAKPSDPLGAVVRAYKLFTGERMNMAFPFSGFLILPVLIFGGWNLRSGNPGIFCVAGAATFLGYFFAIYSPEDWTDMPRYFAPYLPSALILLFSGLQAMVKFAAPERKSLFRLLLAAMFLMILLFYRVEQLRLLGTAAREKYPGYVLTSEPLYSAVADMKTFVGPDEWVATRRIGLLGYAGKFRIFDYVFGLPDREVIEARNRNGRKYFENPDDPGLRELWTQRCPVYLLEDRSRIIALGAENQSPLKLMVHGIKYVEFRSYYLGREESWVLMKAE